MIIYNKIILNILFYKHIIYLFLFSFKKIHGRPKKHEKIQIIMIRLRHRRHQVLEGQSARLVFTPASGTSKTPPYHNGLTKKTQVLGNPLAYR